MGKRVFVSHSSDDLGPVAELCDSLAEKGIELWVSFKDILPGMNFAKEIDKALQNCDFVLVAISKKSIESDWVHAEVEYAISEKKTVIPVLIESNIEMPIRWRTLQYVDWSSKGRMAISLIVQRLPKSSALELEACLKSEASGEKLKNLLLANPSWVHPDAKLGKDITIAYSSDFFYQDGHTGAIRRYYYYLASPYKLPLEYDEDALVLNREVKTIWERIKSDTKPGDATKSLNKTEIHVFIYAGQREHYTNNFYSTSEKLYAAREKIEEELPPTLIPTWSHSDEIFSNRFRISLSIATYDRLIDEILHKLGMKKMNNHGA